MRASESGYLRLKLPHLGMLFLGCHTRQHLNHRLGGRPCHWLILGWIWGACCQCPEWRRILQATMGFPNASLLRCSLGPPAEAAVPFQNPPRHKKLPKSFFHGTKLPQAQLLWRASWPPTARPLLPKASSLPMPGQCPPSRQEEDWDTEDILFPALPLNYPATYSRSWCYF